MESKEYLKQVVSALVNGDETLAKDVHHAYVQAKSQELLKETKSCDCLTKISDYEHRIKSSKEDDIESLKDEIKKLKQRHKEH